MPKPRIVAKSREDEIYGFLEAMASPKHPEHRSMKTWVGGKFDPEAIHLVEINRALMNQRTKRITRGVRSL